MQLKGKRTYLVALGFALAALGSYLSGEATWPQALNMFLTGGGLAALRAGIANQPKGPTDDPSRDPGA